MEIRLYQSKKDLFVLAVQGRFSKPLKAVHFHKDEFFLSLAFEGLVAKEELDCPIPEDIRENLINQKYIALGFYDGDDLKATQLAPFLVHGLYTEKDFEEKR